MKKDNINYFIVGLFVLMVGVTLLVVLYRLTDQTGPTDRYHVYYHNVSGIKYGTIVSYEGFQVGQVEHVKPERRRQGLTYRVEISVNQGWQIPSDSVARIVTSGLISARMIDIQEGQNEIILSPGAELRGDEQVDLFAAMGDVATDFHRLTTEGIEPTLNVFIEQVTRMTDTLESVASTDIRPFFETLQKNINDPVILQDAKSLLAAMNKSVDNLNRILSEENRQSITGVLNSFEGTGKNLEQLTRRIEVTRKEIHEAASQLNRLVKDNREPLGQTLSLSKTSAEELHNTLTTVSEHINNVMYDLEGTMRNLHEFSREIRENPRILLGGSAQREEGGEE